MLDQEHRPRCSENRNDCPAHGSHEDRKPVMLKKIEMYYDADTGRHEQQREISKEWACGRLQVVRRTAPNDEGYEQKHHPD